VEDSEANPPTLTEAGQAQTNLIAAATERSDLRGELETEILREQIDVKRGQAAAREAAGPDVSRREEWPILLYASIRVNAIHSEDKVEVTDGASRVGILVDHKPRHDLDLFGRVELGFNIFDQLSLVFTPDASPATGDTSPAVTPRLHYAGFEQGACRGLVGKNWSVYYDVAGMADSFAVYGGRAAGVYNAGTDGGGSGTGRADNSLQLRLVKGPWRLGVQGQVYTETPVIDNADFDYAFGAAIACRFRKGLNFGAAFNRAVPEEITEAHRAAGFRSDDEAWAAGLSFPRKRLYLAMTLARTRNQDTDDKLRFLDTRGWETYTRYSVHDRLRLVAGFNLLEPDDGEYAGAYRVGEYIAGVQLAVGKSPTFDNMLHLEYVHDNGRNADGGERDDAFAVGIRWKLSW
jgi:predicted porin